MARTSLEEEHEDLPEADRLEDFPHPRETENLIGHDRAEETLLDLVKSGSLPHGFLITGPRGIGKATLAYRLARFVLRYGVGSAEAQAATSLHIPASDSVFHRVAAQGHGDLLILRRRWDFERKRLKTELSVDEVRRMAGFFSRTAGEGGWRVCIADAIDEMNVSAANALLKLLEEPPLRALILIIAHAQAHVLPTIRSRCRVLTLNPLRNEDITALLALHLPELEGAKAQLVARLAEGSAGRALMLGQGEGIEIYDEMLTLFSGLPQLDLKTLHRLADRLSSRDNQALYQLFVDLLRDFLGRSIRARAQDKLSELPQREIQAATRLFEGARLDKAAELWEKTGDLFARAEARNLDRKQTVLTVFDALARLKRPALPAS
jgi:DNA polymerase-3 subunit delta'